MSNLAVALVRTRGGWQGSEIALESVDDLDTLTDVLRELDGADVASAVVCFIEENDEWLAIVRLAGDTDPRVFLSDRRATEESELAERLFADAFPVPASHTAQDDDEGGRPVAAPAGDLDLLEDLQTPGDVLVELVAEEGLLPSDVVSELCERAGAVDALEAVRS